MATSISPDGNDFTHNDDKNYETIPYEELFGIAMRMHEEGRLDESLKCVDAYIKRRPNDAHAYYLKITILEHEERWADAKECFDHVWDPNTTNPTLLLLRANQLGHLGEDKESADLIKKAEDMGADPLELYGFRAGIAEALSSSTGDIKKLDEAIHWIKEACNIDKKNAHNHARAASMMLARFERDAEISSITSTTMAAEPTASAATAAGKALAESVLYGKEALKLGSDMYAVCYNLGRALAMDNKHDEAIEYFEIALSRNSDSTNAQAMIGMCMASQHDKPRTHYERAIRYIEDALDGDPDVTFATVARAGALLRLGRTQDVIPSLRTYLEHEPKDVRAWMLLGHAYFVSSSEESARDCMKKAKNLDPSLPNIDLLLRELVPPLARD